jgi:hypothetical protein
MALTLGDRVKETTTVAGTGTATLLGATTGFQSFAAVGNGNTTYYCIADQGGPNWEVGIGTYTASGTTLARTTVLASSNAGALVVFTTGVKDVFVTYPSEKGVWYDASGNVLFTGTTTAANLAYTGTLTGSTGILNIGAGQVYKDVSGNVGIGTSSPASKLDIGSGNLNFSGVAQRITGDMSNATATNRLAFQSSTTNGFTNVTILPNGVSTAAGLVLEGDSAQTNGVLTSFVSGAAGGTEVRIASGIRGTGTYLPITIYTGGSERMRIDSSGNVGIGCVPSFAQNGWSSLSIKGTGVGISSYQNTLIEIGNNSYVASGSYIYGSTGAASKYVQTGNTHQWYNAPSGTAGTAITFTQAMILDASGNVGIGTSSPASYGQLAVISATQQQIGLSGWCASGGASALNGELRFGSNTSYQGRIYYDTSTALGNLWLENTQSGGTNANINYKNNGGSHIWWNGATERMRIDSVGNVGIGTSSPSYKLDVTGSIRATTQVLGPNGSAATPSISSSGENNAGLFFGDDGVGSHMAISTAGVERVRFDRSGNVGIGTTSPSSYGKLSVIAQSNTRSASFGTTTNPQAASFFSVDAGEVDLLFANTGSNNTIAKIVTQIAIPLAFLTNNVEAMRIDPSGNVGIGTSSPNASAILDAQSTTKGVRFPNMTTTQKNAITSPAAGLVVFDTTLAKLCLYTGAAWQTITSV